MQDEIPVTELKSAKGHGHPALDVCREEDERPILDDKFQVGLEELEDKVEIFLRREDI